MPNSGEGLKACRKRERGENPEPEQRDQDNRLLMPAGKEHQTQRADSTHTDGDNGSKAHLRDDDTIRVRLLILIAALIAAAAEVWAQTAPVMRLYPVDETGRDPGFRSYVRKLRTAVDARDAHALQKLIADDVIVGPGNDDKGWSKFVNKWHVDDGENSVIWSVLADFLSLGFIREHPSLFLSPYVVWRFPRSLDAGTHTVVIRDKVPLRDAPSERASSSSFLSFDIVERLGESDSADGFGRWVQVRAADGKTGYVHSADVMSPVMPRGQFSLRQGRWRMVALEGPDQ